MSSPKHVVEDSYKPLVEELLQEAGFAEVKAMPRNTLFDFMAKKQGAPVFIEAKTRSLTAKTQTFVITERKLARLRQLKITTGNKVYLIFVNRQGHKIVEIDDFWTGNCELKPMQVSYARNKDTGSHIEYAFDATKLKWREVNARPKERPHQWSKPTVSQVIAGRPITDDKRVTRCFYRQVPYEAICNELKRGREAFVESITRQTAWFAARKLSTMMGKTVVANTATITMPDVTCKGYTFNIETG